MLFIKNNAKLIIGVCVSLAIGLAGGYGLSGLIEQPEVIPEPTAIDVEPVGAVGELSILPDTQVTTRYNFILCGHEVERIEFDGELTGCTKAQVTHMIPNSSVSEFEKDRVIIERDMQAYCPAHFVLTLTSENKLTISHTDSEDLESTQTQELSYDASALPDDALLLLRESLVFDDLDEINAFFEEVES